MQRCEHGPSMTANDEDAELHCILAMTEEEFCAHIAAQGLDGEAEVAKLKSICEIEPMEQSEKALFGASLDDIMNLSEFADLETRPVGFVRRNQEGKFRTSWSSATHVVITSRKCSTTTRCQHANPQSQAARQKNRIRGKFRAWNDAGLRPFWVKMIFRRGRPWSDRLWCCVAA
jgi:hypothetical protein